MQTLDFVSGLHNYNCLEFTQPLSCFLLLNRISISIQKIIALVWQSIRLYSGDGFSRAPPGGTGFHGKIFLKASKKINLNA